MGASGSRSDRREGIWVDWRFQVRHTIQMVGIAVALVVVLFAMYGHALDEQTKLLGLSPVEGGAIVEMGASHDEAAAFDEELRERARIEDRNQLLVLATVALALVVLLTALAIRVTFRVAGPVHAISGMMRALSEGSAASLRPLRRRDEFRQLEEGLFAVRDSWRRETEEDAVLLRRLADVMSGMPDGAGSSADPIDALVREARERADHRMARFSATD